MSGEMLVDAARAAGGAVAQGAKRSLTMADVGVLDQLVKDLPAMKQLSIGRNLLADARVHSSPIVRGPLAAIRSGLRPVETSDVAANTLLANVRSSIDQEINRIDGVIPSNGYDGHPDYMVVGSIRENLNLLEALKVI
jgi:hypothetical protein